MARASDVTNEPDRVRRINLNPLLPWRERARLRRRGRADGRRRMPRPSTELPPLTTAFRREIFARRNLEFAALFEAYVELRARLDEQIRIKEHEICVLEDIRDKAAARVTEPGAEHLTAVRSGEENTPETIRLARRRREHARTQERFTDRVHRAEEKIADLCTEIARFREERASAYRVTSARAWTAHHRAVASRAAYDEALLARHPQGDLIASELDEQVPETPSWMTEVPPEDTTPGTDH